MVARGGRSGSIGAMPQKIFISYRREDAGANALGISQYLEKEFGRKNVFIDVDMRAGTKFPVVLEERLAECKVLLALIGPEWLNARDEHGQRRIDLPDDWVRLEIAQALKRDITVIPVRVNGAPLPSRENLPEDIRGLLDHQAVSLTLAGFRHEMSGLARDIRAIPSPRSWRRLAAIAAGLLIVLGAAGGILAFKFPNVFPQAPKPQAQNDIWKSRPGEWVMFASDGNHLAYYFKPSSVQIFGDKIAYTARYPTIKLPEGSQSPLAKAAYEEAETVMDCKKSMQVMAERIVYDRSGEVINHFKRGDPQSLDFSSGEKIPSGSILAFAQQMFCDEQLRTPLSQQIANTKLSFLAINANGNGDIFDGPTKKISDSGFQLEALLVMRMYQNHDVQELFPGPNIIGLPRSYRNEANPIQINCADRKVIMPKVEYYDEKDILVLVAVPYPVAQPVDVKEGTPFGALLKKVCGVPDPAVAGTHPNPAFAGTYEGTITTTYKSGGKGEQQISITVESTAWNDSKLAYKTAAGAQGQGVGKFENGVAESISLQSTTPGCAGSYEASFKFADDAVTFSFKGEDCSGPMEGNGTAKRVKT